MLGARQAKHILAALLAAATPVAAIAPHCFTRAHIIGHATGRSGPGFGTWFDGSGAPVSASAIGSSGSGSDLVARTHSDGSSSRDDSGGGMYSAAAAEDAAAAAPGWGALGVSSGGDGVGGGGTSDSLGDVESGGANGSSLASSAVQSKTGSSDSSGPGSALRGRPEQGSGLRQAALAQLGGGAQLRPPVDGVSLRAGHAPSVESGSVSLAAGLGGAGASLAARSREAKAVRPSHSYRRDRDTNLSMSSGRRLFPFSRGSARDSLALRERLFSGLLVRMGVATGLVPAGIDVHASGVFEVAKGAPGGTASLALASRTVLSNVVPPALRSVLQPTQHLATQGCAYVGRRQPPCTPTAHLQCSLTWPTATRCWWTP